MANSKKKNGKKIKKVEYSDNSEISKLIKLIVIVTLIVLAFYGITAILNNDEEEETQDQSATIQYDEILIGNVLKQPNEEYYVMIYDDEDYDTSLYSTYLDLYKQKDEAIRIYTSQLNNPLNQNFKAEESNLDISDISDLKIQSSTLLKINVGKIEEFYEGKKLVEHLKEISKTEEETE